MLTWGDIDALRLWSGKEAIYEIAYIEALERVANAARAYHEWMHLPFDEDHARSLSEVVDELSEALDAWGVVGGG